MDSVHPNSKSLLLYGRDSMLLHVRSLVLARAGFDVYAASSRQELKQKFEAEIRHYDLLVLCHPVPEKERGVLSMVATQSKIPVYQLGDFIKPQDLIGQVSRVLPSNR